MDLLEMEMLRWTNFNIKKNRVQIVFESLKIKHKPEPVILECMKESANAVREGKRLKGKG